MFFKNNSNTRVAGTGENVISAIGHVLLTFLVAYLVPFLLFDTAPELFTTVDLVELSETTAFHVLIFHLVGWYRGMAKPIYDQKALHRKIWFWSKFFFAVAAFIFLAWSNGVDIESYLMLDMALICWAYFNGIIAVEYFLKAADESLRKKE